ncbi:HDOD domain-containing protein [Undibacterium griseum]|uniref:HDOD domain-containing protein n=1 Tax=Undibacterium griseum TaxID=2762295 RepID=A0ABR6YRA9_9BURK|nr:HDOD domain-containing protein [Undibacterium griseum]MBC3886442.1 HDOD domain-containing protein [Undibacterium griseum]
MTTDTRFSIHLDDVIRHIRDLPTLPEVAQELLAELDNDENNLDLINEKISMDHSLTAKVLRLANSSHYGMNSRVVTVQQATSLLGVKSIKNLIRTTILANRFPPTPCEGFDFRVFWRHSIATAICAELISRALHMKHDFAFTAGLLHDIGRLVLVISYPDRYAAAIQYRNMHDCYMLDAERTILQVDHIEAGVALAQQWHFADAVQDAIRGHHQPEIPGIHSLASVIHVADAITHALDLSEDQNDLVPTLSKRAWDTLALSETEYLAIFKETEMRVEAVNQILT